MAVYSETLEQPSEQSSSGAHSHPLPFLGVFWRWWTDAVEAYRVPWQTDRLRTKLTSF